MATVDVIWIGVQSMSDDITIHGLWTGEPSAIENHAVTVRMIGEVAWALLRISNCQV